MQTDGPSQEAYNISSDEEDSEWNPRKVARRDHNLFPPNNNLTNDEALLSQAKMYQEYMTRLPVPVQRESLVPCNSWHGLAISLKKLYGQPLHYLTNVLVRQWDRQRADSDDHNIPLADLIHPSKAEALIWLTEEVHRLTSSPHYLAKMWASDPMYYAHIDSAASVAPQNVTLVD